jgi:hypothetical protein
MIETNIRILKPGIDLYLNARQAMLVAQDLSPDLVGKTCNALRYHNGLAAAPSFTPGEILVAAQGPLETLVAKGDDWRVEVQDGGETRRLLFSEPSHRSVLVRLVERLLLMEIQCRMDLWRLPDSLRIWYEPEPFLPRGDLAAYRRFEVLAVPIASVGIGIVVDVSTAFFTVLSIADFFREDLPKGDQKDRQERFRHLSQRQKERKGTLLYELARNRRKKCYFVEFQHGVTCATTSSFALDGHDYPSLFAYYREVHPYLDVKPSDPVAKVSFSNIGRPVPVAANKLRLRVMNDSLPEELKQVDKIEPSERVRLIESFWSRLGDYPLGPGRPGVERRFWQPGAEHAVQLRQPGLVFPNEIIPAPATTDLGEVL